MFANLSHIHTATFILLTYNLFSAYTLNLDKSIDRLTECALSPFNIILVIHVSLQQCAYSYFSWVLPVLGLDSEVSCLRALL